MADSSLEANPGSGGALFKVDLVSGTSTPYMKIATSDVIQVIGNLAVTNTVAVSVGGTSQVFGQVSSFPVSTTFVTISSSQVALGGGTQYLDNTATTAPTGMIQMYKSGAANSTMVAVATNTPLPVFAISTAPHALVGTSQVNVASTITLAALNLISSNIFADNAAYVPGTSRLGVVGGYYVSTVPSLAHNDAGALLLNASSQVVIAPGSAEATVSTTPGVRVFVYNDQGQQVTAFGSGTQYVDGAATTTPTGMVAMWKSGAANSTMSAVSSTLPLPIFAISTNPHAISGTSQVNIVSSIALGGGTQYADGATTTQGTGNLVIWAGGNSSDSMLAVSTSNPLPIYQISSAPLGPLNGTSFVSLSSSIPVIVAQSSAPWTINGGVNVSSQSAVSSSFAVNVVSTFTVGSIVVSTAPVPVTQGGLDMVWYPSVTSAPKTIKNSAGRLYDIWFTNSGTSTRWLSLFNASSAAASTGTTVPLMRFGLPGTGTSNAVSGWIGSGYGYQFSTAISCAVTASSATSTDTSAPGTNEVLLTFGYR